MGDMLQAQFGSLSQQISEHQGLWDGLTAWIRGQFGPAGVYAFYILLAAVAFVLVYKLLKFSFEVIFIVVLPSVIAAFLLSYFLPYTFFYLMPATAALFSLGLIFRTVATSKG
jgi:hypothetical protein